MPFSLAVLLGGGLSSALDTLRDSCEYLYRVVRQPLGLMAHFTVFIHRQGENYLSGSEMNVKLLNEPTFL